MAADLPPYAALLSHTVEDVDAWKVGFDSHSPPASPPACSATTSTEPRTTRIG